MYQKLRIYGYQNRQDVKTEYQRRINSPAAYVSELAIVPFSQVKGHRITDKRYPLFYVNLPRLTNQLEKIYTLSREISILVGHLPQVAHDFLTMSQLVQEIQNTNEIEGVKSTTQEISTAIKAQTTREQVRFKQIVKTYLEVIYKGKNNIYRLADIRELYDNLVVDEIDDQDMPDGQYFRAKPVHILDTTKDKIVHTGNKDEVTINHDLDLLISFMNQKNTCKIIKAIITHYFFEYIHPFYDGNGRFGRFLMTSYFADKLDIFSALSLSDAIFADKKSYEEAFIEVSNPNNFGEVTFFIMEVMAIIIKGQENTLAKVQEAKLKLDEVERFISEQDDQLSDYEKQVLFVFFQHSLFNFANDDLTNKELTSILEGLSRNRINSLTISLSDKGFLTKMKKKPIVYQIHPDMLQLFE